jgi:hypothetical protein
MPWKAILGEVKTLRNACTRPETLAEQHQDLSEQLTTIAENVRNAAGLFEVLVAIR